MVLRRRTEELMFFAKGILAKQEAFEEDKDEFGFCKKMRKSKGIKQKRKQLRVEYFKLEKELEIFDLENTLTANPVLDVLKLIGGILLAVLSLIFWLHILLYKLIKKNGQPISGFLNDFMLFIEFKIARFVSTIIFVAIGSALETNPRHLLYFDCFKGNCQIWNAVPLLYQNPPDAQRPHVPKLVHFQPATAFVLRACDYSLPNGNLREIYDLLDFCGNVRG